MFGQLVVGPPGAGKSTYCKGMKMFLEAIGRKSHVVNLDPANKNPPYEASLDMRELVTLESVMAEQRLGPNGAILAAMDTLEHETDQLIQQIKRLGPNAYVIFDCPGQVELYTAHDALGRTMKRLVSKLGIQLVVVDLMDCHYIAQPAEYVSVVLLALRTMLQFELPCVHVLSKIDLLHRYGKLPFKLDFYTQVQNLAYLTPLVSKSLPRYAKLTEAITQVIEDFGLVEFQVLAIEEKQSMIDLLRVLDKANGYLFGSAEIGGDSLWIEATRQTGLVEPDLYRWTQPGGVKLGEPDPSLGGQDPGDSSEVEQ